MSFNEMKPEIMITDPGWVLTNHGLFMKKTVNNRPVWQLVSSTYKPQFIGCYFDQPDANRMPEEPNGHGGWL